MAEPAAADALGFFALRAPLLPFAALAAFGEGLAAPAAGPIALEAALAEDRDRSRRRLRELIAQPEVREALFIASPSLEAELPRWVEEPAGERGARVERALVRYAARVAARATA